MNHKPLKITLRQVSTAHHLSQLQRSETAWRTKRHRVYMSFVRNQERWHCRFHQDDLGKTPVSKQFVFASAEKIYEAARRGDGLLHPESCQALDEGISVGRGGIWLHLTEEQHSVLVMPASSKSRRG